MNSFEVNFDGLVGPTHNYSGLSYGNVASVENKTRVSNPREAALQGLQKMQFLSSLGAKQAVLPPHERPHLPTLRALGFTGSDAEVLLSASEKAPYLLEACSSAAAMWAANAATVIPSTDSIDQHVHFIPANLRHNLHRSIEAPVTARILKAIFADPIYFTHHAPLPPGTLFDDEGDANHTRFYKTVEGPGVHLMVYGRRAATENALSPKNYPARQTLESLQAIARLSTLYPQRFFLAQQNPLAIDAGVFHNDVIAVGHRNLLLIHEQALLAQEQTLHLLKEAFEKLCDIPLIIVQIGTQELSLEDAVQSYLFNSQILTLEDNRMMLIAPEECRTHPVASNVIQTLVTSDDNPLQLVHYVPLQQSMRNGGGPACLRLRVPLKGKELAAMNPDVLLTDRLYNKLKVWIEKHYRDRLTAKDLSDPKLYSESCSALEELTKMLNLGSIYSFQR